MNASSLRVLVLVQVYVVSTNTTLYYIYLKRTFLLRFITYKQMRSTCCTAFNEHTLK